MISRSCASCRARLSQYNTDDYCAPCDAIRDKSYDEYFASVADTLEGRLRGEDTCKRGHDLIEHGQVVHAGGGRMTRRCRICRLECQREYQRRRRARIQQAA